jgi:hypothetical protein
MRGKTFDGGDSQNGNVVGVVAAFGALLDYVIICMVEAEAPVKKGAVSKVAKFSSQKGNSLFHFGVTRKVIAPIFVILFIQESNHSDLI